MRGGDNRKNHPTALPNREAGPFDARRTRRSKVERQWPAWRTRRSRRLPATAQSARWRGLIEARGLALSTTRVWGKAKEAAPPGAGPDPPTGKGPLRLGAKRSRLRELPTAGAVEAGRRRRRPHAGDAPASPRRGGLLSRCGPGEVHRRSLGCGPDPPRPPRGRRPPAVTPIIARSLISPAPPVCGKRRSYAQPQVLTMA